MEESKKLEVARVKKHSDSDPNDNMTHKIALQMEDLSLNQLQKRQKVDIQPTPDTTDEATPITSTQAVADEMRRFANQQRK